MLRRLGSIVGLRLRALLLRRRAADELDEEFRYHIDRRIELEVARGASPAEARAIALRAMGGVEQRKEECRDAQRIPLVEHLIQDLRYASRALAKSPGFTAAVLLSLALGIGANTAVFSLVDELMFESLPIERPRELVVLNPGGFRNGWIAGSRTFSYPAYAGLRDHQQVFTGLLAERTEAINFAIEGATQRAVGSMVSGNYFEVLGIRPALGRVLSPDDDRVRGGHPVAVLTHGFWVEHLGSRSDIVGQTVRVNGHPFTVVGVSAKGFNGLEVGGSIDMFVPLAMLGQATTYGPALDARSAHILNLYGRLKPGLTRDQALTQLQPLYLREVEQDVAASGAAGDEWRRSVLLLENGHRGTSWLRGALATPLTASLAMTGVVLLIACANIAGLLMARAAARAREITVRLALGASRGRIVRQLLAESALLAAMGGLAGLPVAWCTVQLLVGELGEPAARVRIVTNFIDPNVLGFAFSVSAVTGLLFGLLPALHASRESLAGGIRAAMAADRTGRVRLRKLLVTAQVALGLTLITAAGLFLRTLSNLRHADVGFHADRLLQFSLNPGVAGYDRARSEALFRQVLEELRSLPGVSGSTLAAATILDGDAVGFSLGVEGYAHGADESRGSLGNAVAPGYFSMLGIPLILGREFDESDTSSAKRVVVVNEALAQKYFPDGDPLGRWLELSWGSGERSRYEIVGVVRDARLTNLRDRPSRSFFMPYSQWNVLSRGSIYVRAAVDPGTLSRPIRELVARHDRDVPVVDYRTLDEQIAVLLRPERLLASLSSAFGVLATALAAIGLYGVTAFSVARRTREIGIRMALGARRAVVLTMVLRDVAVMTGLGIAIGAGLSLGLGTYLESQLYGVRSRDLVTLGSAAVVLALVALTSGWLPARRASRVDPVLALRQE